jgi:hypothetical protein
MALLDDAIEASGGMARWNKLERFTLHLSIDGALLSRVGQASRFKEMVAEGSTRNQSVRFTGFADPGKCGLYQPNYVTIESPQGKHFEDLAKSPPSIPRPGQNYALGRVVPCLLLRLLGLELFDDTVPVGASRCRSRGIGTLALA